MRAVVEAAGYRNILTKSLGSANQLNVVWATFHGLQGLKRPDQEAVLRIGTERDLGHDVVDL